MSSYTAGLMRGSDQLILFWVIVAPLTLWARRLSQYDAIAAHSALSASAWLPRSPAWRGRQRRMSRTLPGTGQRPDFWHLCLYLRVVHASEHSLQLELLGAPEVVAAVPHRRRLELRADHQVRDLHEPRAAALQLLGSLPLLLDLQRSPSVRLRCPRRVQGRAA